MKNVLLLASLVFVFACGSKKEEAKEEQINETTPAFEQWKGENRDGCFDETGLLKQWPEEGPKLLWSFDAAGAGYGSPIISDGIIYLNGDEDTVSYLIAIDNTNGEMLWKKDIGSGWNATHFEGSRATPTLVGDLLYLCTGNGDVTCVNVKTKEIVWNSSMQDDLHGQVPHFGYAQSLLVNKVGNILITAENIPMNIPTPTILKFSIKSILNILT